MQSIYIISFTSFWIKIYNILSYALQNYLLQQSNSLTYYNHRHTQTFRSTRGPFKSTQTYRYRFKRINWDIIEPISLGFTIISSCFLPRSLGETEIRFRPPRLWPLGQHQVDVLRGRAWFNLGHLLGGILGSVGRSHLEEKILFEAFDERLIYSYQTLAQILSMQFMLRIYAYY